MSWFEGLEVTDEATIGGWVRTVQSPPKHGEVTAITEKGDVMTAK